MEISKYLLKLTQKKLSLYLNQLLGKKIIKDKIMEDLRGLGGHREGDVFFCS